MTIAQFVEGYAAEYQVALLKPDGTAENLTTLGATLVQISLVDAARQGAVLGPYTASSGHVGASWSTGIVVITIPGVDSAGMRGRVLFADAKVTAGSTIHGYFASDVTEILPDNFS